MGENRTSYDFAVVGAGFVGTSLARALARSGRSCALLTRRRATHCPTGVDLIESATDLLGRTVRTVVHAGGVADPRLSSSELPLVTESSLRELDAVVEFTRRTSAELLIQVSSGGAIYGSSFDGPLADESTVPVPATPYGLLKLNEEEHLATLDDVVVTSLRCTNLYGGLQQPHRAQGLIPVLIRRALCDEPLKLFANPASRRDYLLVDDVAKAIKGLAPVGDALPPVVNVGSGVAVSTADAIDLVERAVGRRIRVELADDLPPPDSGAVSIERLRKLIPWEPTPIDDGIRSVVREIGRQ